MKDKILLSIRAGKTGIAVFKIGRLFFHRIQKRRPNAKLKIPVISTRSVVKKSKSPNLKRVWYTAKKEGKLFLKGAKIIKERFY